jgi:hypothetical protein
MNRQYIIDIVTRIVGDKPTAEMVIERLTDEGVLSLGYGNADIDKVVEAFSMTFGTTKVSKYDRFAANRLCSKYGSQGVVGVIKLLGENSSVKYAPVVNNVAELENKMVSILSFLRTLSNNDKTIEV